MDGKEVSTVDAASLIVIVALLGGAGLLVWLVGRLGGAKGA